MADGYYLTETDYATFQDMVREFRGRKRGPQSRSTPFSSPQAPEVYVAKVPPSGIPGLNQSSTTGTGTDQPLDDVPGRAECEIYQLLLDESGVPGFGRVGELTYFVNHLGSTAISADRTPWVVVVRDKFGEWFVTSRGGVNEDIDFEEIVQTVEVVTAVVSRECGLTVRKTPFTFNFTLPVGSAVSVSVGSGNTGTGTADDGDDTLIDYPTRLVEIPTGASFTFDAGTCTGAITFTTTNICVFSGGVECCPDYTGTGTS